MPLLSSRSILAAAVSAIVVGATAHLVVLLVFFAVNGFKPDYFGDVNAFFLPQTLFTVLFAAVLIFVGGYRSWYIALTSGVVAGLLGALVGTAVPLLASGSPLTGELIGYVVATLVGLNLIFVITVVVASATVGRRVYEGLATAQDAGGSVGERRIAIIRRPAATLADGHVTHIDKQQIDLDLADEQWESYVNVLENAGWSTIEVDRADELADSVFVEDAVIIFGDVAVITSPGSEHRIAETEAVEATVRELGLKVARIAVPGTLDGGDVLKVGTTVYVGRSGRTNAEGIHQLRHIVSSLGYTVVAVPLTKVLHLKSAVTALPDGTVIGYLPLVDDPAIFDRFLSVPEEGGAHVVKLTDDTVLMAASAPLTAQLIENLGYRVISVDISEYEKLEGCVTCLSVRVR
ncbi:dimethylargininase [Subtercola boreus]|uniref:Dimethylarginine dimethylaminohydrolase n=1 Tax=Subtercola boreus TaxID=120213 RepID=A0A3E0W8B5_9MICO|nr:dimethylargininase [Subtercola boreus]RFA19376.1 dimethylarginine dimethylaminohydrolase [Subtercola boreus]RFA19637.1 dimethylarginine dimethylaminohydrolase [Subtercola boreus]RFA26002.1 dimethylarginine dimethylaminohydrolase [Subtercola boreus]